MNEGPRSGLSGDRPALLGVGVVWAGLFAAGLALVWMYGSNVPLMDDWYYVRHVTGDRAVTAGWLWEQFGEHRFPLPRLVYTALLAATRDYRAAMYFQVVAHATLAAGLVLTARRVRGRAHPADAFFPLALLHWGHEDSWLNAVALNYQLVMLLACAPLQLALLHGTRLSRAGALLTGLSVILLGLCGGQGLVVLWAFLPWLVGAGWVSWSSGHARRRTAGLILFASAGLAGAWSALYFVDYHAPTWLPPHPGVSASLRTALQFLGMSLGSWAGSWAREVWPESGAAVAGVLAGGVALLLARLVWGSAAECGRLLALGCFLVGMGGWVAGVGWGRSCFGEEEGFSARFVPLATLVVCSVYFVALLSLPSCWQSGVALGLGGLFLAFLPLNMHDGGKRAGGMRELLGGVERDLEDGMSSWEFMKQHAPVIFFPDSAEMVAAGLPALREAGFGAFADLGEDAPTRAVALPAKPTALHRAEWKDGVVRATGDGARIVFTLPAPRFVRTLRVTLTYLATPREFCSLQLVYRRRLAGPGEEKEVKNSRLIQGQKEETLTVWIGETITEVRIELEKAGSAVRVGNIILHVPVEGKKP